MATKNDITGDTIKTKADGSDKYRDNYDKIFGKKPLTFWEHYCIIEKSEMGMEKGKPCNWCGLYEEDFIEMKKQDI